LEFCSPRIARAGVHHWRGGEERVHVRLSPVSALFKVTVTSDTLQDHTFTGIRTTA